MALSAGSMFHEITAPICNADSRLQAEITAEICNQEGQDGPKQLQMRAEITCNNADEIGSLDMGAPEGAPSESVDRYGVPTGTPSIPPCFISTRAFWASLIIGEIPDRCPSCGSREIAPLFWPDPSLDLFDCANTACHAIWTHRD